MPFFFVRLDLCRVFFGSLIANHFCREHMLASTSLDIGIKPAAGLRPRKLRTEDAVEDVKGTKMIGENWIFQRIAKIRRPLMID